MGSIDIPQTQTVALVRDIGGTVEFKTDYPVPAPGRNEVLAKVLYTGVCQSGKPPFANIIAETKITPSRPAHKSGNSLRAGWCPDNKDQAPTRRRTRRNRSDRVSGA